FSDITKYITTPTTSRSITINRIKTPTLTSLNPVCSEYHYFTRSGGDAKWKHRKAAPHDGLELRFLRRFVTNLAQRHHRDNGNARLGVVQGIQQHRNCRITNGGEGAGRCLTHPVRI